MPSETGEAIDARRALVAWAESQLGEQDPRTYYAICAPQFLGTKPNEKSWCGVFCLAGLRVQGLCDWTWSDNPRRPGFVGELRSASLPEPGDIAVFRRGADGRDLWHHAIVERCESGRVYTIDGNTMRAPKEGVTRGKDFSGKPGRPIDGNVTFYSIATLLSDKGTP